MSEILTMTSTATEKRMTFGEQYGQRDLQGCFIPCTDIRTFATKYDLPVAQDLLDTLAANSERCVGMAANMISVNKRIIVAI